MEREKSTLNYEEDMFIDETSLEVECLEQSTLTIVYGKHWSALQEKVDVVEEELKLIKSTLIEKAHKHPDKYLGEGIKPTGPIVEAFYRNHKKHTKAKENWISLKRQTRDAEIAYKAISYTRKAMLEELIKLHGQQYFAGPAVPGDITKKREERQSAMNKKIGKNILNKKN